MQNAAITRCLRDISPALVSQRLGGCAKLAATFTLTPIPERFMAYTISNEPLTHDEFISIQKQLEHHSTGTSITSISEMDGFFTAVISCAQVIPFDVWYPAFWGGPERLPKWTSDTAFQRFFDLLVQHMNQISMMLAEHPDEYSPIFNLEDDEETLDVVDWCYGYQRGVALDGGWPDLPEPQSLMHALIAMNVLLMAERSGQELDGHLPEDSDADGEAMTEAEVAELMAEIDAEEGPEFGKTQANPLDEEDPAQMVRFAAVNLHAYWAEQRSDEDLQHEPARALVKVGRNDPCPCGSGKKYKQCCL
jgi:uncharacterized protein